MSDLTEEERKEIEEQVDSYVNPSKKEGDAPPIPYEERLRNLRNIPPPLKNPHDYTNAVIGAGAGAAKTAYVGFKGRGLEKPNAASLQRYLNSQLGPNLRIPLNELEKITREGKPIRTMAEVQEAITEIKGSLAERVGKTTSINPSTGQPRKIYQIIPGQEPIDLSKFTHNPTILNKVKDELVDLGNYAKKLPHAVMGPLGGALAVDQLADAAANYKKENENMHIPSGRNFAQFLSGLGGLPILKGTPISAGIGAAMQIPEVMFDIYDWAEKKGKESTPEIIHNIFSNVDEMGNPR
jgi:hypothetical protein